MDRACGVRCQLSHGRCGSASGRATPATPPAIMTRPPRPARCIQRPGEKTRRHSRRASSATDVPRAERQHRERARQERCRRPSPSAARRRPGRRAGSRASGRDRTCCVRRAGGGRSARRIGRAFWIVIEAVRGQRQHQDAGEDHGAAARRCASRQPPSAQHAMPLPGGSGDRAQQRVGEDAAGVVARHHGAAPGGRPASTMGPHIWTQCRLLTRPRQAKRARASCGTGSGCDASATESRHVGTQRTCAAITSSSDQRETLQPSSARLDGA